MDTKITIYTTIGALFVAARDGFIDPVGEPTDLFYFADSPGALNEYGQYFVMNEDVRAVLRDNIARAEDEGRVFWRPDGALNCPEQEARFRSFLGALKTQGVDIAWDREDPYTGASHWNREHFKRLVCGASDRVVIR